MIDEWNNIKMVKVKVNIIPISGRPLRTPHESQHVPAFYTYSFNIGAHDSSDSNDLMARAGT